MRGRATFVSILTALAGVIVMAIAIATDQLVSVGSILGVLLVVSGALRYVIARQG